MASVISSSSVSKYNNAQLLYSLFLHPNQHLDVTCKWHHHFQNSYCCYSIFSRVWQGGSSLNLNFVFGCGGGDGSEDNGSTTPWSRVLQNLIGHQLVKKFPTFCGTQLFFTEFLEPCTFLYPELDQLYPCLAPPHLTSWRSTLILLFHLYFSLSNGLFQFPLQNLVCTYPLPHMFCLPYPAHSFWFDHPNNIWCGIQIIQLVMWSSPLHCYIVTLRTRYFPQHPILKHIQPMFLPPCERPTFTPVQDRRENCSSVYFNIYIFG